MAALYKALMAKINKSGPDPELASLRLQNQALENELFAMRKQAPSSSPLAVGSPADNIINGPGLPVSFNADGLATVHNCDFMRDPLFQKSYKIGAETKHKFGKDLHIEWRVFVACWAASQATSMEGDFVECGVNTGIISSAVMSYVNFAEFKDRKFYLLDTYEGIPEEQLSEKEQALGIAGHNRWYEDCYAQVCETFKPYANARIIRGLVPDTLAQIDSEKICYLSIDLNCTLPEIAAGDYLWPRLVKGAIIVLDDYGWMMHINQKYAWDEFAAKRGLRVLGLPTGQGLIIKP